MSSLLLEPVPQSRSTAFERTLLPGFVRWFIKRVEQVQPDYLIPAETKGARLLEVVLEYARKELGVVIETPVLYRPALAYLDPAELTHSRILVLDDARRTGNNFNLHSRRLGEFGATDVHAAICVCLDPEGSTEPSDSYLLVEEESDYREYVLEMTELVVASGLPPEVDHLVFEVELPGALTLSWPRLEAALASYGDLSIDAPRREWGELRPVTLHYPGLPGTTDFPEEGEVRNDGPRKLRAFPDPSQGRLYVIPVSFPALDLPSGAGEDMSFEMAQERIHRWTGSRDGIASLLLEEASQRDPETLFRALSVFAELDLICGLARVLAGVFPVEAIQVRAQRELLDHLFGIEVGALVAEAIETQIDAALSEPAAIPEPFVRPEVKLFLDRRVVQTCERVAEDLRELYERRATVLGQDPPERIGRSLVGISTTLGIKRLLVSRCIDYGLALTTLVPYVDVVRHADGSCRIERKYRVSEQGGRGARPAADREIDNQEVAEEILAYIALHLRKRVVRYSREPLPVSVATRLIAIMRPLLEGLNIRVQARTGTGGLVVEVERGDGRVELGSSNSLSYLITDATKDRPPSVAPSELFLERNRAGKTKIDRRGVTIPIEGFLEAMRPLLDAEIDDAALEVLLTGAAASSSGPLGLSAVQAPIEIALDRIEASLIQIQVNPKHDRAGSKKQIEDALLSAQESLEMLSTDWSTRVNDQFDDPSKTEQALLGSMGVPKKGLGPVYLLPEALIEATRSLQLLTERLDEASERLWLDHEDPGDLPVQIFVAAVKLEQALSSLRDPSPPAHPKGDSREQISLAADALLNLLSVLRAFAAAFAGSYRGPRRGEPLLHAEEPDRFRTVLFPDLAGSKNYAQNHSFDQNFDWKSEGLGLFAQWGRAFGGIETRSRAGDCLWHEFEERGEPALLCAAAIRVHVEALEAPEDPRRRWPVHLAVHFGRIKDDAGPNTIGLTLDEMNQLCRLGEQDGEGKLITVTQDVLDSCSPEFQRGDLAERIDAAQEQLPPQIKGLSRVRADAAVELHAAHLRQVATGVVADLPGPAVRDEEDLRRVDLGSGAVAEPRVRADGQS